MTLISLLLISMTVFDLSHLFILLHIPDLHLTSKVPETGQDQDVTLRTENRMISLDVCPTV